VTKDELRTLIERCLKSIAPESEPSDLSPVVSIREELDLDSMDFLNFVTALHDELRIDIPESDYDKIDSMEGCIEYLSN